MALAMRAILRIAYADHPVRAASFHLHKSVSVQHCYGWIRGLH